MATLATLKQSAIDYLAAKITDSTATSEELVLQTKAISQIQEVETLRSSGRKILIFNDINFQEAQVFVKEMTSDTSLTFSNFNDGETRDLLLSGNFVPSYPSGVTIVQGTYDPTATNVVKILCVDKTLENFYLFINPDTNLIVTDNITDSSITNAKMADDSVNTTEIVDNAVTLSKMADNSVGTAEIIDESITSAKMVNTHAVSVITTNTTAVRNTLYVLNANLTLTLPASPSSGDSIKIADLTEDIVSVLGANGNNIMGQAQDVTLNTPVSGIELVYTDSSNGWVIIGQ